MDKNQLIKNINKLLDDSPFDDYETRKWQEKMTKMNETDLQELFNLLNRLFFQAEKEIYFFTL